MCHKKIAVLLSIIILLGMCVVPGISNTIYKNKTKDDEFIVEAVDIFSHINTGNSSYANANWWPMFRHDTFHTGYSTGDAPNTGILKWHYITEGNIESSPSVANDKLYISSNDFYIYCLDIWDGDKIWQYKTGQDVFSSPAVVNGMVYVGSNDQKVYCLDAEQGNFIWSFSTGGEVRASPAIVDGNVYVGSRDGYIYC